MWRHQVWTAKLRAVQLWSCHQGRMLISGLNSLWNSAGCSGDGVAHKWRPHGAHSVQSENRGGGGGGGSEDERVELMELELQTLSHCPWLQLLIRRLSDRQSELWPERIWSFCWTMDWPTCSSGLPSFFGECWWDFDSTWGSMCLHWCFRITCMGIVTNASQKQKTRVKQTHNQGIMQTFQLQESL